jgi:hypothetical protein
MKIFGGRRELDDGNMKSPIVLEGEKCCTSPRLLQDFITSPARTSVHTGYIYDHIRASYISFTYIIT